MDRIIQREISRCRFIIHGMRTGDNMSPIFGVLILPDPEHAVDHAMVYEEGRVTGGGV